jgi:hypothetical protein
VGEILNEQAVQEFLHNKDQTKMVNGLFEDNIDDLMDYLKTGKSAKYDGEKLLGHWEFNVPVTVAWLRQSQPKIQASEMRAIRALWSEAYAQTTLLVTADKLLFVRNFPRFVSTPSAGQAPFTPEDWKGDWSKDDNGTNYTLHISLGGQDKYMTATTDGLRMSVKEGHNLLIFDHAD